MPETIFGMPIVEAIIFTVVLFAICLAVYRLAGQATDIAMEMMMAPIAILIIVAIILFIGLWLYRQGQWSMQ